MDVLLTLPENIFGHFVGTIAKCLAGILTAQETMILSSMTACEATARTSLLYLVNLLLPSVHPNLKQWWLKNSSPKMKGLVIPSQTTNLWVKLQGPILKPDHNWTFYTNILAISSPYTCTAAQIFGVRVPVQLLCCTWCNSTCAPVSNSDENTWSCTFILNLSIPHIYEKYLFFFCTVTCVLTSIVLW